MIRLGLESQKRSSLYLKDIIGSIKSFVVYAQHEDASN